MSEQITDETQTVQPVGSQGAGSERKPYQPPRIVSGDVFERIVLMTSESPPVVPACSDVRLKSEVQVSERSRFARLGLQEYTWTWNQDAKELYGLEGRAQGVLAQEAQAVVPSSVCLDPKGYLTVDYGVLETCASQWSPVAH